MSVFGFIPLPAPVDMDGRDKSSKSSESHSDRDHWIGPDHDFDGALTWNEEAHVWEDAKSVQDQKTKTVD